VKEGEGQTDGLRGRTGRRKGRKRGKKNGKHINERSYQGKTMKEGSREEGKERRE
jgi:hypothetical protein